MRSPLLRTIAVALALCVNIAAAQDAPRDTGPGGPLPGPNANTPGSENHSPDATNRVQPVPGAMPGSDAVPSTLSPKNAADDKLITTAYTFKNLTADERRAIYDALKDQPAGSAFNADVGIELPPAVELRDMLNDVVMRVPQTKGYQFAVAGNRILLVSPANRVVVATFPDAKGATTGEGLGSPR